YYFRFHNLYSSPFKQPSADAAQVESGTSRPSEGSALSPALLQKIEGADLDHPLFVLEGVAHVDEVDGQGMAERHKIGRALRPHDARNLRYREYIALG